jgi:uncharacterized membrane protein
MRPITHVDMPRLAALSDGIFAVAMTLLVAALSLPKNSGELGGMSPGTALLTALPQFKAVAISFFIAAAYYWWRHHDLMRAIAHGDTPVLWLNFLLLFGVVLTPLATKLLAAFSDSAIVVDLFAGDLVFIGAMLFLILWHAARNEGILNADIDRKEVHRGLIAMGASVLVFLASMPLAWASAGLALWSWLLLIPISWLRFHGGGRTKV